VRLDVRDHDRAFDGQSYVYPVVSRRAAGLSIGINLNPNNACNWRCVYCQVPGLVFGKAPPIELDRLEAELEDLLAQVVRGDFLERFVPAESRRLNDVALSGNGEPTSSPQLAGALERIERVLERMELLRRIKVVLITNGSLLHLDEVRTGLRAMSRMNGEIWYKLDSATEEGAERINSSRAGTARALSNLREAARICPTWIQTCLFAWKGREPSRIEQEEYLAALARARQQGIPFQGVLLYGLARPSHQPEARELSALSPAWLEAFAARISLAGIPVKVFP
jgi:wyosine [tRNA(Phe)-imidazoG37] synthetase (radical SAM superfamily)